MKTVLLLATITLLGAFACGGHDDDDKNNELMAPGQNCLSCHVSGGAAGDVPFTLAGTVFASASADTGSGLAGITVIVTDANQVETTLITNAAGNFFTRAALALPLKKAAVVRRGVRTDMGGVPEGGCNRCHTLPAAGGAGGRIYAP